MSMEVDFSTPLTNAERAYLEERGKLAEIQRADSLNGVTNSPEFGAGDGTGPQLQPLLTSEQRALEKERLKARLAELEEAESGAPDADEIPPYESWKSNDLNKEIDARNEGRSEDQKISKSGTVQDRATRLYADDEALSQQV